jgi:hypothetical protein
MQSLPQRRFSARQADGATAAVARSIEREHNDIGVDCLLWCIFTALQAFAGLDLSGLDAAALLSVVMYHFCPHTQPWKLVVSRSRLLLEHTLIVCADQLVVGW